MKKTVLYKESFHVEHPDKDTALEVAKDNSQVIAPHISSGMDTYEAKTGKVISRISTSSLQHFQKLFKMSACEVLLNKYSCALVAEILFHGTLYISTSHLCFNSILAGNRHRLCVPLASISSITRKKTAGFIPNAIAIETRHVRYLFTSFISRENAFNFIWHLWQATLAAKADEEAMILCNPPVALVPNEEGKLIGKPLMTHRSTSMGQLFGSKKSDSDDDDDEETIEGLPLTTPYYTFGSKFYFWCAVFMIIFFCISLLHQHRRVCGFREELIRRVHQLEHILANYNRLLEECRPSQTFLYETNQVQSLNILSSDNLSSV